MKIELTKKEAREILSLMGNGYGNGDFYTGGGYGGKREENAAKKAYKKIADKLNYEPPHNELS